MSESKEPKNRKKGLQPKQLAFIERYVVNGYNASEAARYAGYAPDNPGYCVQEGYRQMHKPEVLAAIQHRLKEMQLGPEEVKKDMSGIAKGRLNDYLIIRKVPRGTKVNTPLRDVINRRKLDIEDERMFRREAERLRPWDEDRIKQHEGLIHSILEGIIRLEITLKRDPSATLEEAGPDEMVDRVEIDWQRLKADAESGRIKSLKFTEFGPAIELYGADGALRDMAKIHGLFEKDNAQRQVNNQWLSPEAFQELLNKAEADAASGTPDPSDTGE